LFKHNTKASFIITSDSFVIENYCCEDFKSQLIEKTQSLIKEQTKEAIIKMTRNAFGK